MAGNHILRHSLRRNVRLHDRRRSVHPHGFRRNVHPHDGDDHNSHLWIPARPSDKHPQLHLRHPVLRNITQAHGLCFSVKKGVDVPPSLVNIYKELHDDLGCTIPNHGCLTKWAEQGVLMLNTVLTVRAHQANSHKDIGWEEFTDAAIMALNSQDRPIVFILWGAPAQRKARMLNNPKHLILKAPHPSPLSAYRGFFGSKPFSQTNDYLRAHGIEPIDWQIE